MSKRRITFAAIVSDVVPEDKQPPTLDPKPQPVHAPGEVRRGRGKGRQPAKPRENVKAELGRILKGHQPAGVLPQPRNPAHQARSGYDPAVYTTGNWGPSGYGHRR